MRSDARGFTLLEVLVAVALIGISIIPMLAVRERSQNQAYQARNANLARALACEILSEIEFHGIDRNGGPIDGYPGFEFEVEIHEEDLLTGESAEDDKDPYGKKPNASGQPNYVPGDAMLPPDAEKEYPVRIVRLTLRYPSLQPDAEEPESLVIETIFPALPDPNAKAAAKNPFGTK